MARDRIDVPVSALAALAERERVGQLHVTLRPSPIWLSDEDRAAANKQLDEALTAAGLLDGKGRAIVDFLDWLPVLTTASLEYYGWLKADGGETVGVLAASRGLQGVIAMREGDNVLIKAVDHNLLAEALIDQLPPVGPGGGSPRTVRVGAFAEAERRREEGLPLDAALTDVVALVQRPVTGSGELYAGRRDEVGRYTHLEQPLHYADTDWGRYFNYTTGSGDDAEVHLGPAAPATLVSTLRELASGLGTS